MPRPRLVKCTEQECGDKGCRHRRKHKVFQDKDADDGLPCTAWMECYASFREKKVRCVTADKSREGK